MGKKKYDWSQADLMLGTMPDNKLGEMFDIPTTSVYRRRRSRGITAYGKRGGGERRGQWASVSRPSGLAEGVGPAWLKDWANPIRAGDPPRPLRVPVAVLTLPDSLRSND